MHVRSLNEKLASGKFAPDSVELKVRIRAPSTIHEQRLACDHNDPTMVRYFIFQERGSEGVAQVFGVCALSRDAPSRRSSQCLIPTAFL